MTDAELRTWAEAHAPAGSSLAVGILRLLAERDRLKALDQEWYLAARAALRDQLDPPHGWKDGDPWPEADTSDLYEMYRGRGWTDTPEPVAKMLCDLRDAALAELRSTRNRAAELEAERDELAEHNDYLKRLLGDANRQTAAAEAELADARRVCESLAARCAGQAELLAARAAKGGAE